MLEIKDPCEEMFWVDKLKYNESLMYQILQVYKWIMGIETGEIEKLIFYEHSD